MTNRTPLGVAVLGALALAAIIGGVILTAGGHDAAMLWALAGTASGAIGGVMMPTSTTPAPVAETPAPSSSGAPIV